MTDRCVTSCPVKKLLLCVCLFVVVDLAHFLLTEFISLIGNQKMFILEDRMVGIICFPFHLIDSLEMDEFDTKWMPPFQMLFAG